MTGAAAYVRELLANLVRRGSHDYDIFVSDAEKDQVPVDGPHSQRQICLNAVKSPIPNIVWHHSVLPFQSLVKGLDVVHIPSIRRIPCIKGSRLVATIHDMAPFHVRDKYDRLRTFYHHSVLPSFVRRADHLITVSEYTKQDIIRFTGYPEERISVVYNGVDVHRFRRTEHPDVLELVKAKYGITKPFFFYVARIEHPAKNHIRLIEAFKPFAGDYELVLAGADWHGADEVHTYAQESAVAEHIHFTGFIPTEDIVHLYSACDLVVFPSLFEGFGLPLIEAMACQAPVVCSHSSSLIELAEGRAPTFDPYSVDAMRTAMHEGLSMAQDAQRIQNNLDYARGFSWDRAAADVESVYAHVCEDR
jgi:glycosyltransferase involved in cell wall biosynthesis